MTTAVPIDAPEISETEQLEALGKPVVLANGEEIRLRYDHRAQRWLERQYGGLGKFSEAAKDGAQLSALWDGIYAGTLHLKLGDIDDVLDRFDERRLLTEYAPAFQAAFAESVPLGDAQEIPDQPTPRTLSKNLLGPNSNTSPGLNSAPVKTNSGE